MDQRRDFSADLAIPSFYSNTFQVSDPVSKPDSYLGNCQIFQQLTGIDVQIKFFILDEADMMLSQGFDEDVDTILETVPDERQTMLFSATMPGWVKNISRRHLKQPVMVDLVGESSSGRLNEDIK